MWCRFGELRSGEITDRWKWYMGSCSFVLGGPARWAYLPTEGFWDGPVTSHPSGWHYPGWGACKWEQALCIPQCLVCPSVCPQAPWGLWEVTDPAEIVAERRGCVHLLGPRVPQQNTCLHTGTFPGLPILILPCLFLCPSLWALDHFSSGSWPLVNLQQTVQCVITSDSHFCNPAFLKMSPSKDTKTENMGLKS